jgi:hypothetical protein
LRIVFVKAARTMITLISFFEMTCTRVLVADVFSHISHA